MRNLAIFLALVAILGCKTPPPLGGADPHPEFWNAAILRQVAVAEDISQVEVSGYAVVAGPRYVTTATKSPEAVSLGDADYEIVGTAVARDGKPALLVRIQGGVTELRLLGTLSKDGMTVHLFRGYPTVNGKPACLIAIAHPGKVMAQVEICQLSALFAR